MKIYKAEAIVIGRRNSGESDKIITLFTRKYGKIKAIAKGIRKITSRRASYLELFTHVKLVLHQGRTFDLITEVESLDTFFYLRRRLERIGMAYVALELTDKLNAEHQESPVIFHKLLEVLTLLNTKKIDREQAKANLFRFKHLLLTHLGFMEGRNIDESQIDSAIEKVIEQKLKSPRILTNLVVNL